MATSSPKKAQRVKPKSYSICLLYNTAEAQHKLSGLKLASCNRSLKTKAEDAANQAEEETTEPEPLQLAVSDKMSCNYCDAVFAHRPEQKRHYRSDWHRYNLKQRLKGKDRITEDQFEDISGNISSLSGSDTESEGETDTDQQTRPGSGKKLPGSPRRLVNSGNTSTDSESESGNQSEDIARRLPKVYFKNKEGEIMSLYRCVLCHKKSHPSDPEDLVTLATSIPDHMNWAVFMAAGGHFAGAVFNKNQMVAHKTFHRYVVRAKRGTAQGSRDSQGNAPKSAGATLRRYNEAALTQEIQELITSWNEHIQQCDRIFLRAPSFNRKIFFSGKTPPFSKDDARIRLIPFQTRRPTFNEVRRVYEMLASIECYGDESDMQDLVPISPPQVFNPETGQLTPRDENQLTPRQRRLLSKKIGTSPLALAENKASCDSEKASIDADGKKIADIEERRESKSAVPGHVLEEENMSSGGSTASDTELVETMATINLMELKEFACSKKPKKKKKSARKRKNSLKCQTEPETNVMEEEKYHLKNSLYTACKMGDKEALKNLLAVLFAPSVTSSVTSTVVEGQEELGQGQGYQEAKSGEFGDMSINDIQGPANKDLFDKIYKEKNEDMCMDSTKAKDPKELEKSEIAIYDIIVKRQGITCTENDLTKDKYDQKETITSSDLANNILTQSNNNSMKSVAVTGTDELSDTCVKAAVDEYTETVGTEPTTEKENVSNVDQNTDAPPYEYSSKSAIYAEVDIDRDKADVDSNSAKSANVMHSERVSLNLITSSNTSSLTGAWPDFSPVVNPGLLSEPFGDNNTTFLHVAAKEGHGSIVKLLMEAGANPSIRDRGGLTPYMVSKDKTTRNEFRRFMGKWPEKYDYEKAQIPGPLTEEMESERKKKEAEKKKAQKKLKQEQQKVKRELEEKQKAEEREKQRFLNLSDREKRALAAEKRLVSQFTNQGAEKPVLRRCFQCGSDMTGKVPFEYCDNKFCTSKCLQMHRKSLKKS